MKAMAETGLKNLLQGGGIVLAFKIIGAAGGLLFSFLLSRYYGAEGLGLFEFALAWLIILALFSKVGLDTAILKIIPDEREEYGPSITSRAIRQARLLIMGIGALLSSALYFSAPWIESAFGLNEVSKALQWSSMLILPLSLLQYQGEIHRARHDPIGFGAVQTGFILALSCLPLFLFRPFTDARDGFAALTIILLGLWAFLATRRHRARTESGPQTHGAGLSYAALLRLALPMMVYSGMYFIISWTDSLMVGYFLNEADLGVYRIAFKLTTPIAFVAFATNGVGAPHFSRLHSLGDIHGLREYVRRIMRLNLLLCIPMIIGLLLLDEWILEFFGEEFIPGAEIILYFCLGQFVLTVWAPAMQLLTLCGEERIAQYIMISWALLNALLNSWLIPTHGLTGAAVATSITMAGWNLSGMALVRQRLGFWMSPI